MKFDILYNFISPVTGRILSEKDYVLIGNKKGVAVPSPILIDLRLDLIKLREDLNNLLETTFITAFPSERIPLPNIQVLSSLEDGFMFNNAGIISTISAIPPSSISLTKNYVLTGDDNNKAKEVQRLIIDNLPTFANLEPKKLLGAYNLWTGSSNPLKLGQPTTTLSLQRCNMANLTAGYVWIGKKVSVLDDPLNFGDNRPIEVKELPLDNMANLSVNKIWIGDISNRPVEGILTEEALPDLQHTYLWVGDNANRPEAVPTISLNNLPDLTFKRIWRGTILGRPNESDDLTLLEADVAFIKNFTIPALQVDILALQGQIATIQGQITFLQGAVAALQGQVAGLILSVAALETRVNNLETAVATLQSNVTALQSAMATVQAQIVAILAAITAVNMRIDNLRLNNILASGNVSLYNYKIINLANPTNPQDAVTKYYVDNLISTIPGISNIVLTGDVSGAGPANLPITTTFNLTLNQIPNAGNIDINNFRIFNVQDAEEEQDAVNYRTMWNLFNDPSFYVNYINPQLEVLGPVQQFIFNQNRSKLQIINDFTPTPLISSKSSLELLNSNLSGYRIVQETGNTQNLGDLYLERFIDAEETGEKILGFSENLGQPLFYKDVSMNYNYIKNLADMPDILDDMSEKNAINFEFLFRLLNDEII